MQEILFDVLIIAKYIAGAYLVALVVIAPLWIAQMKNPKDKPYTGIVRLGALVFGWTGIGWLIALFFATKK